MHPPTTPNFIPFLNSCISLFLLIMSSLRSWVSDHKLAAAGTVSASAIGAAVYKRKKQSQTRLGRYGRVVAMAAMAGLAVKHFYFDAESAMGDGDVYPAEWSEISGSADSEERWSW